MYVNKHHSFLIGRALLLCLSLWFHHLNGPRLWRDKSLERDRQARSSNVHRLDWPVARGYRVRVADRITVPIHRLSSKKKKKTRELKKSYWRRILFRLGRETLVNIRSAGHDHRHYGRLRADELGGPGARSSIFPRYVMARDALNVTKSHQRGFYRPLYCDATRRNFFSLAGSAAATVRERERNF